MTSERRKATIANIFIGKHEKILVDCNDYPFVPCEAMYGRISCNLEKDNKWSASDIA